jgi:hypothetical protein
MTRLTFGTAAIGTFVLAVSIVSAQAPQGAAQGRGAAPQGRAGRGGPPAQPEPTNLQILPKDMTRAQVVPIMQAFNAGLGVACNYCHVTAADAPAGARGRGGDAPGAAAAPEGGRGRAAGPAPQDDFAADTKAPKRVARTMMLMSRDINSKLGAELGKPAAQITQVQCVTCHRGVPIPKQLVDIVAETTTAKNTAAALDQYRELRKQFHGSAAYDFSDLTLFQAAQRAIAAMRPDDALAYLNANIEFHPNSARSYQQMSVAYQRKMDTPNAIKMLEKAVELDPMNAGFRNQLNQLKNPAPPAQ